MQETAKVIIVQADKTILLDTHHPLFEEVRKKIGAFSELVKTPEHIHFYRITPISLWNSAANNVPLDEIITTLDTYKKYEVPKNVFEYIRKHYSIYGQVLFENKTKTKMFIRVSDAELAEKIRVLIEKFVEETPDPNTLVVDKKFRGEIK